MSYSQRGRPARAVAHVRRQVPAAALAAALFFALPLSAYAAATPGVRADRGGKEVYEDACAKCHGTGAQGAPRVGDSAAWKERSAKGLTALTQRALKGVRKMPPHGARFDLTDVELKRAITYMVNQSGGKWAEPVSPRNQVGQRTGRQIVEMRCSQCHEEGKGGAPRIGDRTAWIQRLRNGFEHTVSSAIKGHGGMPARGGLPDLTDHEVRGAIVYMFNPDPK